MNQKILLGIVLPLLLIGVGVGVYVGLGSTSPEQITTDEGSAAALLDRLPVAEVHPARGFDGSRTLNIDVTGIVVPFREITVAAEVAGRVVFKSKDCQTGRFVTKDEVLYRIDKKDFELEVERLLSQRDQALAQIEELEQEIDNSAKMVELSREDVALQDKEIDRLKSLPDGYASETELDTARRALLTSRNQLLTTNNQVDLLKARRNRLELAVQLAGTQLEQAQVNLNRCEIKAPISGVIVSESAEEDSFLQRGATICSIEDTSRVEVLTQIRSDQLMAILSQESTSNETDSTTGRLDSQRYKLPKTPVSVTYTVAGMENTVFSWKGYLSRYDGLGLDPKSRTVPCRITVEKPGEYCVNGQQPSRRSGGPPALVRGMFVDAEIQTQPATPLILIPKLAYRPGEKVWKFVHDPTLLEIMAEELRIEKEKAKDSIEETSSWFSSSAEDVESSNGEGQQDPTLGDLNRRINPDDWLAGRIQVIRDVRGIRLVRVATSGRSDQNPETPNLSTAPTMVEFWVVEPSEDLAVEDVLITSPLANLLEDGSDRIRVKKTDVDQQAQLLPIEKITSLKESASELIDLK
jgi:multidrug efflux pump subunit AcrA (membrane-fusion protein)